VQNIGVVGEQEVGNRRHQAFLIRAGNEQYGSMFHEGERVLLSIAGDLEPASEFDVGVVIGQMIAANPPLALMRAGLETMSACRTDRSSPSRNRSAIETFDSEHDFSYAWPGNTGPGWQNHRPAPYKYNAPD
jgi:hypothetical protein